MLGRKLVARFTLRRAFGSLDDVAQGNYTRFRTSYMNNLSKFREEMGKMKDSETESTKKSQKAYSHPYNNKHFEVNLSPAKGCELMLEFLGPEQVSPHYESFLASRKWAIGFWTTSIGLAFAANQVDLHWVAKSMIIPFTFWTSLFYWTFEGRKSILKPLYMKWYRALAFNDVKGFQAYYKEAMRIKIKRNMDSAKEQMDYYLLHQDFNKIKAESINRFLAHEQMNLQLHISNRAENLLKSAAQGEKNNQRSVLNKVVENAIAKVDAQMMANSEKIEQDMFETALLGISKGVMDYENDPILPIARAAIREEVSKVVDLSQEEQLRLVALSEEQLTQLRNSDEAAKKEYLETAPKLDAMTNNSPTAKAIFERWGQ